MTHYNLALLGFGNVGQSLLRLLQRKAPQLAADFDLTFSVTAIGTAHHGLVADPRGLDIDHALRLAASGARLEFLTSHPTPADAFELLHSSQADVLFENTPVDYHTGQPALGYLRAALELNMHAITANKGPVVHGYSQLTALAAQVGRKFYFESAVMDGAPIFSLFRHALPAADLHAFHGILNSCTNLILGRMEEGETLDQAIAYAQSIGITETDPSGDVDGWDAAVKIAALVTVLMGIPLIPSQVERQGIRHLTPAEVAAARQAGQRWKLVCSARREGDIVHARVAPELVTSASPLYGVEGTSSVVTFETDVLTQLSIVEGNPGPDTTAYGLLADFINAARGQL
jgi:homoserine dehydrogenase